MTSDQAKLIIEAHSIEETLNDEEELGFVLQGQELLIAYKTLKRIADNEAIVITNCNMMQ